MIEDNHRLSDAVRIGLAKAGFAVDCLETLEDGAAALATTRYDGIILDLGLPDGDGGALLARLRRSKDTTPILILTARDGLSDRVDGLNAGADDYLPKPFAMEELVARIRALMRRPGGNLGVMLEHGNVQFDTIAREVHIKGQTVTIARREMTVLEQLLRRAGRVVPKSVMEDNIYGFDDAVASNSVEVAVHRLRRLLEAHGASLSIHTIRGVGYLMTDA